jgi:hypothetical protein
MQISMATAVPCCIREELTPAVENAERAGIYGNGEVLHVGKQGRIKKKRGGETLGNFLLIRASLVLEQSHN